MELRDDPRGFKAKRQGVFIVLFGIIIILIGRRLLGYPIDSEDLTLVIGGIFCLALVFLSILQGVKPY